MLQPDGQKEVAGGKKSEKVPVVGKESFYQRIPIAVWSAGIAAMTVIALGLGCLLYTAGIFCHGASCVVMCYL